MLTEPLCLYKVRKSFETNRSNLASQIRAPLSARLGVADRNDLKKREELAKELFANNGARLNEVAPPTVIENANSPQLRTFFCNVVSSFFFLFSLLCHSPYY